MKRRELIKYCFGSSLSFSLLLGCTPTPANIANIIRAVQTVQALLALSRKISNENAYALNVSFAELGTFRKKNDFSIESIQVMEGRSAQLTQGGSDLRNRLNETDSEANSLFSLLTNRAKENSDKDVRKSLLSDIRDKQKVFREKMKDARSVLSDMEVSIQTYDDVLGAVQVKSGLGEIDKYISDVDEIIDRANILNQNIQSALERNQQVIASFDISE